MGNQRGSKHRVYVLIMVQMLVRYKPEIPDPKRRSFSDSVAGMGYDQVTVVDCAKFFQLKFKDSTLRKARADAKAAGAKLLANPVIEVFEIIRLRATGP